jgi:general stress protein CsbA
MHDHKKGLALIGALLLAAILVPLILGVVGIAVIRSPRVLTVLIVVLIAASAVIAWKNGIGRGKPRR